MIAKCSKIFTAALAAILLVASTLMLTVSIHDDAWAGSSSSGGNATQANSPASIDLTNFFTNLGWKYDKSGKAFGKDGCPGIYTHSNYDKANDSNGWMRWSNFVKLWRTQLSGSYGNPSISALETKVKDPAIWEAIVDVKKTDFRLAKSASSVDRFKDYVTKSNGEWCWIVGETGKRSYINWLGRLVDGDVQLADAIWVEKKEVDLPPETGLRLVKTTGTGTSTTIDRTGESAKSLYENPTPDQEYRYTFGKNDENHRVTGIYQRVKKEVHQVLKMKDGKWVVESEKIKYTKLYPYVTRTRDIQYNIIQPKLNIQMYQPLNLNTNTFATNDFMKANGYNNWGANAGETNYGKNLDGSVDNNQGITDGTAIQSVDLNLGAVWKTKLGIQFGLPESDINMRTSCIVYGSDPGRLSADWSANKLKTCKVYSGTGGSGDSTEANIECDGYVTNDQYGGLQFYYGVDHSSKTTSVQLNGKDETTGDASIAYDARSDQSKLATGGIFLNGLDSRFRGIKEGTYLLTSEKSDMWWMDEYEQAKEYTVGCTVNGKILGGTTSITAPQVQNQGKVITSGNNRINHEVNVRKVTVDQPVLYGKFEVDTVRGNVEK